MMKKSLREGSEIFIKRFEWNQIRNPMVYSCLVLHPVSHASRILKVWGDASRFYTAEKWIQGKTLYDILMEWVKSGNNEEIKMQFRLLQSWKRQIQTAADELHRLPGGGVIHGDISPKNIMVTLDDNAVLIDFNGADFGGKNQPRRWFATKAFSEECTYFQGILTEESDWIGIEKTFSFARHILYRSQEIEKIKIIDCFMAKK